MPCDMSWYDPDQIMLVEFRDHVTVDELSASAEQMLIYLNNATQSIQFILDLRRGTKVDLFAPTAIASLTHYFQHPNLGWSAVLGMNPNAAFLFKLFVKSYDFQYVEFDSLDDAVSYLRQVQTVHKRTS